jgi:hypothetical protein
MSRRPKFQKGQWVTWVDPDEEGFIMPHIGEVEAWGWVKGYLTYTVKESETLSTIVIESELTLIPTPKKDD